MNIFIITLVFLLSGAVILTCLQKFGFTVAKNIFLLVYGLFSVLIPFTLGGELTMKVILNGFFYDEPDVGEIFCEFMMQNLNVGISVFNATTVIVAVLSLIVVIAFIIVSIYAAIKIVNFIRKIGSSDIRIKIPRKSRCVIYYINENISRQKAYLRFCRLLN